MLTLMGLIGTLVAGFVFIGPFGSEASDEEDLAPIVDGQSGSSDTDSGDLVSDILDEDDFDTAFQPLRDLQDAVSTDNRFSFDGDTSDPVDEDPTRWARTESDQIYGKNIGDNFGASMFKDLLFETDAETGSEGADTFAGSVLSDLIFGNDGNDTVTGGAGSDMLFGGQGDDDLDGGDSADLLFGEEGSDLLSGAAGNDFLAGGDGDDTIYGGEGDDKILGNFGADLLDGGAGNDTLDGTQATVSALAGVDTDMGDTLIGGDGDDLLILGNGDSAEGGTGADQFISGLHVLDGTVPMIQDYDASQDRLSVLIDLAEGETAEVTTETLETGVRVLVNGTPIADLANVSEFDVASIELIPSTAA